MIELAHDIAERLDAKLDRTGDCWLWTGYVQEDGYATVKNLGKVQKVHRLAYVLAYGQIPDGKMVDHRCRVRHCARPKHLRAVTNKQNMENQGVNLDAVVPYRGVTRVYRKKTGYKYYGRVYHHGQYYYCGIYDTAEAANVAVVDMRNHLYTHNTQDEPFSNT